MMSKRKSDPPTFKAVQRLGPTQQVREQLLRAIRSGDLAPGSALPPERELASTFGVSRVSIRQAVAALEAMGLLTVQHGRGVFVTESIDDRYSERVHPFIALHRDDLIELADVRGALDELAAAQVAAGSDDLAVTRIRAAAEAFADAVERGDLAAVPGLDLDFHLTIAEYSDGTLLRRLLGELNSMLTESRGATFSHEGQPAQSVVEHRAIAEAIAARDPEAARLAARAHMNRIGAWLRSIDVTEPPD
ncbi:MAG: FCD domain-containing protein [Gordonia sp. (in: high G+C Gram-positive bacteria)]|uniref:FadR/GntR family transcriptional regulator n=1 Tax=Gordonia TaxID=2053 RepID=UPI0032644C7C